MTLWPLSIPEIAVSYAGLKKFEIIFSVGLGLEGFRRYQRRKYARPSSVGTRKGENPWRRWQARSFQ